MGIEIPDLQVTHLAFLQALESCFLGQLVAELLDYRFEKEVK